MSSGQSAVGSPRFAIYPNPNDGVFTIELLGVGNSISDPYLLVLFNTFGEKVYEENLSSSMQSIEFHLPAGIYYCSIKGQNRLRTISKICVIN